jgi:hypothetical protein
MSFLSSRHAYGCTRPCSCAAAGYGTTDRDTLSSFAKVALFFGVLFAVAIRNPKERT